MSLAKMLKNRWILAGGGVAAVIYFGLLGLFLLRLLETKADDVIEVPEGPPALTLNRQGEVLQPGRDKAFTASELPNWLRRLAANKQATIIVTAPADVPYRRVYEVLKLCQAVGFDAQELRADDARQIIRLAGEKKPLTLADPNLPGDDDLMLATRTTVEALAADDEPLGELRVQSLDGQVAVPDLPTLTRYLQSAQETIRGNDIVAVAAAGRLRFGSVLEVLAACRQAGYRNLELSPPPETRPASRDPLFD